MIGEVSYTRGEKLTWPVRLSARGSECWIDLAGTSTEIGEPDRFPWES